MRTLWVESLIPSTRADRKDTRAHGGAGLGLSISKRIVDQMRGTIFVDSEVGSGSEFVVQIPLQETKPREVSRDGKARGVPLNEDKRLKRILVVDDDPNILSIMRLVFSIAGIEGRFAQSAAQGLAIAVDETFDIILSDLQMPGMDGITFCEKLHSKGFAKGAKIVAITARAQSYDRLRALESGFHGYITKPFKVNDLVNQLRGYLTDEPPAAEVQPSS